MSLADFLGKLQKKPKAVRIRIMWAGVTVCMVIVFLFWLWSLGNSLSRVSGQNPFTKDNKISDSFEQLKKDVPTLWGSLQQGLGSVWESFKAQEQPSPSPSVQQPSGVLPLE